MKTVSSSMGVDVAQRIADQLEECYTQLKTGGITGDVSIPFVRGKIDALESSLALIGRTHEIKINIKELGKN